MAIVKFETRLQRKARRRRTVKLFLFVFAATFVAGTSALYYSRIWSTPVSEAPAVATFLAEPMAGPVNPEAAAPRPETAVSAQAFNLCDGPIRQTCVVDGDTFWLDGAKIRVADIDTPEVSEPRCPSEYELGMRATRRLAELLSLGPFELQAWPERDEDGYGRKLRVVVRQGRSLGDQLVAEGLARTWSGRREPWC